VFICRSTTQSHLRQKITEPSRTQNVSKLQPSKRLIGQADHRRVAVEVLVPVEADVLPGNQGPHIYELHGRACLEFGNGKWAVVQNL